MEHITMNPYRFQDYSTEISKILRKFFGYQEPSFIHSERHNEATGMNLSKKTEILFLSNGDSFKYSIPKSSLAHLFGIDTDYLIQNGYVDATHSYDALIELIENPLKIKNKFGVEDYSEFVSPYIDRKLRSIINNISIRTDSCEFFCKFDKNKTYNSVDKDVSYYVVSKDPYSDNYNILILVEDKNSVEQNSYIPRSNLTFDSKEEAIEYLSEKVYYQELAILVSAIIKGELGTKANNFSINSYRLSKLENLRDWADKLNATPNVLSDYIYAVGLLDKNKNVRVATNKRIEPISERIRNKKYVSINENLDPAIVEILEAYNDSLAVTDNQEENVDTYSKVVREKDDLREKLNRALERIEQLNATLDETTSKYVDANEKTQDLEATVKAIGKLIKNTGIED